MIENERVAWAREVLARGTRPPRDMDLDAKAEFYQDLAGAYQVLAAKASEDGDMDAVLDCGEVAAYYADLATQYQPRD